MITMKNEAHKRSVASKKGTFSPQDNEPSFGLGRKGRTIILIHEDVHSKAQAITNETLLRLSRPPSYSGGPLILFQMRLSRETKEQTEA